jgi:hypothetical protein
MEISERKIRNALWLAWIQLHMATEQTTHCCLDIQNSQRIICFLRQVPVGWNWMLLHVCCSQVFVCECNLFLFSVYGQTNMVVNGFVVVKTGSLLLAIPLLRGKTSVAFSFIYAQLVLTSALHTKRSCLLCRPPYFSKIYTPLAVHREIVMGHSKLQLGLFDYCAVYASIKWTHNGEILFHLPRVLSPKQVNGLR